MFDVFQNFITFVRIMGFQWAKSMPATLHRLGMIAALCVWRSKKSARCFLSAQKMLMKQEKIAIYTDASVATSRTWTTVLATIW